jgi:RimJ/RimL family protein N-acetyltransferase
MRNAGPNNNLNAGTVSSYSSGIEFLILAQRPRPFDDRNAERHISEAQERHVSNNGFEAGIWAIWSAGQLAGCIPYNYIDRTHKNTELGYWLGPGFEGHGLVTKASNKSLQSRD